MPILNYTTKVDPGVTIGRIQKKLAASGARQITTNYDNGFITALMFRIDGPAGELFIKLPVNAEAVLHVMEHDNVRPGLLTIEHAYSVAWRILQDWIDAQLALLESQMVTMEQIFLPYVLSSNGQTVYELISSRHFQLGDGK